MGVAASLAAAVPANAQTVRTTIRVGEPYQGPAVDFDVAPQMVMIPGSRVEYIRDDNYDYDLYRYGGRYYFVDDGNWYEARSWRGPFRYVLRTSVPQPILTVPSGYRRYWITVSDDRGWRDGGRDWNDRDGDGVPGDRDIYRGTQLRFRREPRMSLIPRTRIYYIRDSRDTDLYRFGNSWYYVEDGDWYRASTWRGPFTYIRFSSVPRPIRTVPMRYRRTWSYSSGPSYRDDRDDRWRESRPVGRIGDRYSGTFTLSREPRMSIIPDTQVFYLRDEADYDLYRFGGSWYLVDDGVWYRGASWRGPFYRIRDNSVPSPVYRIPSGYRKTWVPAID